MSRQDPALSAKYVLERSYERSLGTVIGRFLGDLRDCRIGGVRTRSGRVLVPPTEYDPETGEVLDEWVEVSDRGTVTTWSFIAEPRPRQPLDRPFAWALIRLDGADTAILHAVDVQNADQMRTGMRVRARWNEKRLGSIRDIACFEPESVP
jgi:uncharacterized protein